MDLLEHIPSIPPIKPMDLIEEFLELKDVGLGE